MQFEITDIKRLRKRLGLTQTQLSKLSNVSQSLITKIESNKLDPTYSKAKKIFEVLENINSKNKSTAKDVMKKGIIFVKIDSTIDDTIKLLKKHDISQLPVVSNNNVVGLISETSLINALMEGRHKDAKISEICEEAPPSVSLKASVEVVGSLLKHYPLVLVTERGGLKGIITKADIIEKSEWS